MTEKNGKNVLSLTADEWALIQTVELNVYAKDGTEYLVFNENTASYGYLCGNDTGFIAMFNRLVDTDNIAKININGSEFKAK